MFENPIRWLDTTPVASSDKPCRIETMHVEASVHGLVAEVTQTLRLYNPNRRDLSADICIAIPERAIVCGYALEVEGQLRDAVVVEKDKARIAFEQEQRVGADPGLVEAIRGNTYRTRVYPIPAKASRGLRLCYVTPLTVDENGGAMLELPMPKEQVGRRVVTLEVDMPGSPKPKVGGLGDPAMLQAQGVWKATSEERDVCADGPIRIGMPTPPSPFVALERDGEDTVWFLASEDVSAALETDDTPTITDLTVLWDASGSRGDVSHNRELELLHSYCSTESIRTLTLVTFANRILNVREFTSADELIDALRTVHYDGATSFADLSNTLSELPHACAGAEHGSVCLLFTDGLDTLSEHPRLELPSGCATLAIVSGGTHDSDALRDACKGRVVDIAFAPKDPRDLARMFGRDHARRHIDFSGPGVADVCDASSLVDGRRTVLGRLVWDETVVFLGEGGAPLTLDAREARPGTMLGCAWAARRVAALSSRATESSHELLSLGRRFGVVSPVTSLIVFETLDQWLRHNVEPPASWERMRQEWKRFKRMERREKYRGRPKRDHLRELERAWKDHLDWWHHDYAADMLLRSVRAVGGPSSPMDASREVLDGTEVYAMADSAPAVPFAADESAGFSAPMMARASAVGVDSYEADASIADDAPARPSATVCVRPWMPNTPYLTTLDEALRKGEDATHDAYHAMRAEYCTSPSYFLDCASWFMAHDDIEFGLDVLSNLAELRIDDAALLRVMAWRLREAGRLREALGMLRRVLLLRSEDAQSHRDMALVCDELARKIHAQGDPHASIPLVLEAASHYRTVALTPWERHPISIALFAVEEYNVLKEWAEAQEWGERPPQLKPLSPALRGVPDCDLRITLAWDADETDIDIHVTEPSGEEAYYAHRLTCYGGHVSEDITDGYGPEQYEIRRAQQGDYTIRAHYFASHQQSVFGPATCTLTVYTDWGRTSQQKQITTRRLDQERQMIPVGTATYGASFGNHAPKE